MVALCGYYSMNGIVAKVVKTFSWKVTKESYSHANWFCGGILIKEGKGCVIIEMNNLLLILDFGEEEYNGRQPKIKKYDINLSFE